MNLPAWANFRPRFVPAKASSPDASADERHAASTDERRGELRRALRMEKLQTRDLMAGDVDFFQSADITAVRFEIDSVAYYADESVNPAVALDVGDQVRITGIEYDVAEDAPTEDGVIAFEVYRRRLHGALEIGSYDYTDGRFADPVENSLAAGSTHEHPGVDEGWIVEGIDNRITVVAIRYVGDTWNIEDRFSIDITPIEPELINANHDGLASDDPRWQIGQGASVVDVITPTENLTGPSIDVDLSFDSSAVDADSSQSTLNKNDPAVALLELGDQPGDRFEVTVDATGRDVGDYVNGFVVLDYTDENDFVYAGMRVLADRWVIGHYDGEFNDIASFDEPIDIDQTYDVRVAVEGSHVAVAADGVFKVSHDFERDLSDGSIGLTNQRGRTEFSGLDYFDNHVFESQTPETLPTFDDQIERARQNHQSLVDQRNQVQSALDENRLAFDQYQSELNHRIAEVADAEAAYREAKDYEKSLNKADKDVRKAAQDARKFAHDLWKELSKAFEQWQRDHPPILINSALYRSLDELDAEVEEAWQTYQSELDRQSQSSASADLHKAVGDVSDAFIDDDHCMAYSLNFNHQDDGAFTTVAGHSERVAGQFHLQPGDDGLSLAILDDDVLPHRTETRMYATMAADEVSGTYQNGFIVFDYQSPDDFKFAGARIGDDYWTIGHYQNGTWTDLATTPEDIAPNISHELQLWIEDDLATLLISGRPVAEHRFESAVDAGSLGVAAEQSRTRFDQVAVMQLYGRQVGIGEAEDPNDQAIIEMFA